MAGLVNMPQSFVFIGMQMEYGNALYTYLTSVSSVQTNRFTAEL